MSVTSRLIEWAKGADALLGRRLALLGRGGSRVLPGEPDDVLVIRLWGLGNLALLAPQFGANDHRRLRLLTLERNVPFVARQLSGVECLGLPDPVSPIFPLAVARLARRLARDRPQLVLDCEQSLRLPLALARWASGAPCVGLDTPGQGRASLLDARVLYDPLRHVGDSFAAVWARAGLRTAQGPGGLTSRPHERRALRRRLGLDERPLVVLHPGSGDHFPGRRWPAERFGALTPLLSEAGRRQVVVSGSRGERGLVRRLRSSAAAVCQQPLHDLSGRLDLAQLVDLLAGAALLLTNDTGPLHIADALGTPSVGLFGPNTPHRYGPRRPGSLALHADLPCSPCLDDRAGKRSSCRHFACMTELTVPAVARACQATLQGPASQRTPLSHALSS